MDEADYCNLIGMMYQGELIALASPDAIKDRLPGVLAQIDCDRPGEASELLRELPEVFNVSVHGAQVHVTLESAMQVRKVEKVLSQAGFQHRAMEIIQPSLEDAFISMVMQRRAKKQSALDQTSNQEVL
jgi:ABC-2 type transport system ATP-binding protein